MPVLCRVIASWILPAWLALLTGAPALAAVPAELPIVSLRTDGLRGHSVSAHGEVFAVRLGDLGAVFIQAGAQSLRWQPLPEDSFPPGAKPTDRRLLVNPDGRFVLQYLRGELVVRALPAGAVVWRGAAPAGDHVGGEASGLAYFYDAANRTLKAVFDNVMLTHRLPAGEPAVRVSEATVTFTEKERRLWANHTQAASFSADGKTLWVGNMDGEVLGLDVSAEAPALRWRTRVFDAISTTFRKNDQDSRHVVQLVCADDCTRLIATGRLNEQLALLDAASGRVVSQRAQEDPMTMVGLGGGLYVLSQRPASFKGNLPELTEWVREDLSPVRRISGAVRNPDQLAFGFKGGFAWARLTPTPVYRFVDVAGELAAQQRLLDAERAQQATLARQLPEFRRQLKPGDDSHCGLVVERRGDIVLVETAIGQKWLKLLQLHQPGGRPCRFSNGVYQD